MAYDSQKHHRRSIRLAGYDYTRPGAYFVTLVTYQRACLFGEIVNGEMHLNGAGKIAHQEWLHLAQRVTGLELGAFVIMPNHIHAVLILHSTAPALVIPSGPPRGSLGAIIGLYKSRVTRRLRLNTRPAEISVWQRNYYEYIIRSDTDHQRIVAYIECNPATWPEDDENPLQLS